MEAQRFEEALAEFDAAARTARDADARGCIELGRVLCLLQLGREDEAAMAVADGGDDASPRDLAVRLARVCALSGRTLDALQLLSALVQDDPAATGTLFDDPRLAALRDHPMFLQLLGRL
jgi:thioredoxin-like negative regulator of GroEL